FRSQYQEDSPFLCWNFNTSPAASGPRLTLKNQRPLPVVTPPCTLVPTPSPLIRGNRSRPSAVATPDWLAAMSPRAMFHALTRPGVFSVLLPQYSPMTRRCGEPDRSSDIHELRIGPVLVQWSRSASSGLFHRPIWGTA